MHALTVLLILYSDCVITCCCSVLAHDVVTLPSYEVKLILPVSFRTSALFAMEINVTKNLLTGENTVVSTATVPAEELKHHAGLKVYDDGRKCVYALNSQEVWSD